MRPPMGARKPDPRAAMIEAAMAQKAAQSPMMRKKGGMAKGGESKAETKSEMKMDKAQDKAMVKKAVGMHDKQMHGGKKTDMAALKKGGMPMLMKDGKKVPAFAAKSGGMAKGGGVESKGKTQGKMIKMNRGGRAC